MSNEQVGSFPNQIDAELKRLMALGTEIRSSGKWSAANEGIKWLAATIGPDQAWELQVVSGLFSSMFSEFGALERGHQSAHYRLGPQMAWHARNLLEIQVWAAYCATGSTHSRRLYEDAGRDAVQILQAFMRWGAIVGTGDDWLAALAEDEQDLRMSAAVESVSLDGSYLSVAVAAKECGLETHYRLGNKFLSKFAHPTALVICAQADPAAESSLKDYCFALGSWFFADGFKTAARALLRLANNAGLEMDSLLRPKMSEEGRESSIGQGTKS